MRWIVALPFLLCAAAAQHLQVPPPVCIYPSEEMCTKRCYCAWCEGRCFEVSRFEKDMPPLVEAACGASDASYTTYMYSEFCERQTERIEASEKVILAFLYILCGAGLVSPILLGCYVWSWRVK